MLASGKTTRTNVPKPSIVPNLPNLELELDGVSIIRKDGDRNSV